MKPTPHIRLQRYEKICTTAKKWILFYKNDRFIYQNIWLRKKHIFGISETLKVGGIWQKSSKTANKIPITSYFMRLRLKKVCFFAFFSSNWAANSKKGRIFAPQTHYSHSLDALLAYKKEIVLHMETRFLWLFVQRSTPRGRELSYSFPIITSVAYAEDAIRFHLCGNRHWLLILFLFHKFVVLV